MPASSASRPTASTRSASSPQRSARDTFPVGADPKLDVARAYDVALAIPGTSLGFANRVSYVIAPDGRILEEHQDSGAESHIATALAAVEAWRKSAKR